MDQFTRRIVGFGVHRGVVDGPALCRMFKEAIRGVTTLPKYLSSDHDPLYRFHQWQANLRVLEVIEIKTVPGVPPVASICRTVNRDPTTRVLGPNVILDDGGAGDKAPGFSALF